MTNEKTRKLYGFSKDDGDFFGVRKHNEKEIKSWRNQRKFAKEGLNIVDDGLGKTAKKSTRIQTVVIESMIQLFKKYPIVPKATLEELYTKQQVKSLLKKDILHTYRNGSIECVSFTKHRKCPECNQVKYEKVYVDSKEQHGMVRCKSCGATYFIK